MIIDAPVIVIETGDIRGVFATWQAALEFIKQRNCRLATLVRDDGHWDVNKFRGKAPWTIDL